MESPINSRFFASEIPSAELLEDRVQQALALLRDAERLARAGLVARPRGAHRLRVLLLQPLLQVLLQLARYF